MLFSRIWFHEHQQELSPTSPTEGTSVSSSLKVLHSSSRNFSEHLPPQLLSKRPLSPAGGVTPVTDIVRGHLNRPKGQDEGQSLRHNWVRKKNFSDSEGDEHVVGAGCGKLLLIDQIFTSTVFTRSQREEILHSVRQLCGGKRLVDCRGQRSKWAD